MAILTIATLVGSIGSNAGILMSEVALAQSGSNAASKVTGINKPVGSSSKKAEKDKQGTQQDVDLNKQKAAKKAAEPYETYMRQ